MSGTSPSSAPATSAESFFTALLRRDASGSTWLPELLAATPYGQARLGDLVGAPGWIVTPLAVTSADGRLAAFGQPVTPPRELLRWFIDHPNRLTWPAGGPGDRDADRLRRALLCDEPPGAQARAQDRARELLATRSPFSREWWRFEDPAVLDCVLITGRLVITVTAPRDGVLNASTPWYPPRSQLVRDLEAARHLAGDRRWATLALSPARLTGGSDAELAEALATGAPHLDDEQRRDMRDAYLGNLTWAEARAAVGDVD